ncbi:uncharacterized protein BKCO1_6500037 [Diplodia corticola]|uniref:Uncharacterized protein n=1 Tax=Diplodia corticola TaxID=236234 RepID=A0A1J9RQG5_9PEZI|nr:uncharacterized protein BKCO1_6500037 [Diplodia corticola]OJD30140.1 hypothetical protein BKCO1_6500037 [Diplodia corticola]
MAASIVSAASETGTTAASDANDDSSLDPLNGVEDSREASTRGLRTLVRERIKNGFYRLSMKSIWHPRKKSTPPAVVFPYQNDGKPLDPEDFIRDIELIVRIEDENGTRDVPTKTLLPAKFDFGFDEGSYGDDSLIILNRGIVPQLNLPDGLITYYEDPENPPVRFEMADGSVMKLYGELDVKWAIRGVAKKCNNQKLFPTGEKFIRSRCVLMREESPHSCLIGWNTIQLNKLDQKRASLVDAAGRRDDAPKTNKSREEEKKDMLKQQRSDENRAQQMIQVKKRAAAKEKRKKDKGESGREGKEEKKDTLKQQRSDENRAQQMIQVKKRAAAEETRKKDKGESGREGKEEKRQG